MADARFHALPGCHSRMVPVTLALAQAVSSSAAALAPDRAIRFVGRSRLACLLARFSLPFSSSKLPVSVIEPLQRSATCAASFCFGHRVGPAFSLRQKPGRHASRLAIHLAKALPP
jgi:hypothetical protein